MPTACPQNSLAVPLINTKGVITGNACIAVSNNPQCPSGYTMDLAAQACRQLALYKRWQFWTAVGVGTLLAGGGATLLYRRRARAGR